MSLTTISGSNLVKKQVQYKLKAYIGVFGPLIVLQIIAMVFSLLGNTGMYGGSSYGIYVNVSYYSADIVIVFTIIWAFVSAVLLTTRAYREDDFTFVTNRLTANISNVIFLAMASVIGGTTAILSGYFIKAFLYFVIDSDSIVGLSSGLTVKEFLVGLVATSLAVFLFGSIGYIIGMVVQISKLFIILLPVLLVGVLTTVGLQTGTYPLIPLSEFFFQEPSLWSFFLKVVLTSAILFFFSIIISNRMEVRK